MDRRRWMARDHISRSRIRPGPGVHRADSRSRPRWTQWRRCVQPACLFLQMEFTKREPLMRRRFLCRCKDTDTLAYAFSRCASFCPERTVTEYGKVHFPATQAQARAAASGSPARCQGEQTYGKTKMPRAHGGGCRTMTAQAFPLDNSSRPSVVHRLHVLSFLENEHLSGYAAGGEQAQAGSFVADNLFAQTGREAKGAQGKA